VLGAVPREGVVAGLNLGSETIKGQRVRRAGLGGSSYASSGVSLILPPTSGPIRTQRFFFHPPSRGDTRLCVSGNGKDFRWNPFSKASSRYSNDRQKKAQILNAADSLHDHRAPSGNRLESPKGDRKGQHSIRINDKYPRLSSSALGGCATLVRSRKRSSIDQFFCLLRGHSR
jgi:hypothetical protein